MRCAFAAIGTPDEYPLCKLLMVYAGVHSQLWVPQTSILYASCSWYPGRVTSMHVAYGICGCAFAAIGTPDEYALCKLLIVYRCPGRVTCKRAGYMRVYIRSHNYPGRVTCKDVAYYTRGCAFAAIGTPDELPDVAYAIGTPDELPVNELGICGRAFAAIGTPDEYPPCKLLMVYAGVHLQP
ncbi:unnamed protein product [Toxocara canis]|uniref:CUB domain-containing protein n=1 Tax=Toxocara canis TaxID=6265 RepID=A0A183U6Q3_TOXCA|nr:unnamed protein product [Toxocara canis]